MLLGLILIFFVGKAFYELAGRHKKNQWGFAILGIATYYAGIMTAGFLMGIISELGIFSFYEFPEAVLGIMAFPFGVLACWGTYTLLKKHWSKAKRIDAGEILDAELFK